MTSYTPTARVGTPKPPPLSEYQHLSEKERMLAGYPYKPWSDQPELTEERARAHKLNGQFNSTAPGDAEKRRAILKDFLHPDSKDKKLLVEPPFRADYGYNIRLGNNFFSGFDVCILDSCMVDIGDDVMLAPGVHLYTAYHPLEPIGRKDPSSKTYYELSAPITIGNTVWIGGRSIICPGVKIGDNVVVGAGSVVTKDVPSNVVVAGNPAKIIRFLDGADLPAELKHLKK